MRDDQLISDLLEPFNENTEVPPYITMSRDEFIADKRKLYAKMRDAKEGEEKEPDYSTMPDDEFLEVMKTDGYTLDEEGNEISTYNKQSKWDWWGVGGRWNNKLKLKKPDENGNERCSYGRVKDINFDADPEVYEDRARFWELYVEGAEPENDNEEEMIGWVMRKKEFFVDRFGTKENYATLESFFTTWAVLTPDGKWHEKGDMGWFGMSGESHEEACEWLRTFKEKFIDTADPEMIAVVVDCHI